MKEKLQKLPLGIQDFEKIVNENFLYIDKTQFIYELISSGAPYFLSRPRRFGKSLLISTIEALFRNKRELFKGLWIDNSDYVWQEHPVIRLDMSRLPNTSLKEMNDRLLKLLEQIATDYQVDIDPKKYSLAITFFDDLITKLSALGQVVILIDEYDKPLLNKLMQQEEACAIRDFLRDFYTIIKAQDGYLKFILLTGVSKFSKVSIFSGINNLTDLTMANAFSAMLGYTETEIQQYFATHIAAAVNELEMQPKEIFAELKKWYNGYRFSNKAEPVYNPFSVLSLLMLKEFKSYWFATGTPTFLVELLQHNSLSIPKLDHLDVHEDAFSTYEVDNLVVLPLLYQTGYLTVKAYNPKRRIYTLGFPNYEVKTAFLQILLEVKTQINKAERDGIVFDLIDAIEANDLKNFFATLKQLFAKIPYDLYQSSENYYQTIFYLTFTLIGQLIDAEVHTNTGRIDAVIKVNQHVYIFEFKLDRPAKEALAQINERNYPLAFSDNQKTIHKIGVSFSSKDRNVQDWLIE